MRSTREARPSAAQPIAPENLQVIAAMTPDPVTLYAVEGRGVYRHEWVGPRWGEMFGIEPEEKVGRCFQDFFPGAASERFHKAADEAVGWQGHALHADQTRRT